MTFRDVSFPAGVAFGSRGGPRRRTDVVALASGFEERNQVWSGSRREYAIGYGIKTDTQLAEVVALWEAMRGRRDSFRFRDRKDHKSCAPDATPGVSDQVIGTGTGALTNFQLVKSYGTVNPWTRTITKPVAGSVVVSLAGVAQATGWTVNTTTGVVTFAAAPGSGVTVRAGFLFDVPVRFDADEIDVVLDAVGAGSIADIKLIEVRE